MAGDWIKFEKATLDKPEVFEMAGILGIDPDAVIGKLLRVWDWFDDQSVDGYAPVTLAAQLNRNTGYAGFTEAMQKVGWMEVEGDRLKLPNFSRHNGQTAKDRALSAKRMSKKRSKCYADTVTHSVTSPQPEKRREEKNIIPPNPQGGIDELPLPQKETPVLPDGWKKLNSTEQRRKKVNYNTPLMVRVGRFLSQRETTLWTIAEYLALQDVNPTEDELEIIGQHYSLILENNGFRYKDILTLLNNWPKARTRAEAYFQEFPEHRNI